MNKKQTLSKLRKQLRQLPEPEPVTPWLTEPVAPVNIPERRVPPPKGWPDDEGWREEAEILQSVSGEEPQA